MPPHTPIAKQSIADIFARVPDCWSPRLVARVNDTDVRAARILGDFPWHHHATEDELFIVIEGSMRMFVRDPDEREIVVNQGEMILIPRGVEHRPISGEECRLLLVEPSSTINTGELQGSDKTIRSVEPL